MAEEFILINQSKKEQVSFIHLNGSKMSELSRNPAQSAIVTWYLLNNQGDQIQFISDSSDYWPFNTGNYNDAFLYPDITDELISILIQNNILKDNGLLYVDKDDPESIYIRDITNA